jgi:hypothetical protein
VTESAGGVVVDEVEIDPVTGTRTSIRFKASPIGGGVFGFAGGVLLGNRLDFPRPGLARIGWTVRPRVER